MAEITLQAEIKDGKGSKKQLSDLRKERKVPAVVYGGTGASITVIVLEKELLSALKSGGANALIRLKHPKGEDTVIVKALQRHVVTAQPIHADFQRISLKQKLEVKVPLHILGEAPGVKLKGGVLEHTLRDLKVRCLPNAIPQKIEVDISKLDIGQNITVDKLQIPADVEVIEDPHHIVVSVVHATAEAAAPAPVEGAAAAGTEPEVIAKGKKEEEGAEGKEAKDAKSAAPAKGEAKAAESKPAKKEGK